MPDIVEIVLPSAKAVDRHAVLLERLEPGRRPMALCRELIEKVKAEYPQGVQTSARDSFFRMDAE